MAYRGCLTAVDTPSPPFHFRKSPIRPWDEEESNEIGDSVQWKAVDETARDFPLSLFCTFYGVVNLWTTGIHVIY